MSEANPMCSPRLSDLRKAAQQIALEDSQDCSLALQEAARSIAKETGIEINNAGSHRSEESEGITPKRSSSPTTTNPTSKLKKSASPSEAAPAPSSRRKSVVDDVSALASQMNLKVVPKPAAPPMTAEDALEKDADELIKLVRLRSREIDEAHKDPKPTLEPKKADTSYLKKVNRRRSSSPKLKQRSYNSNLSFEPSRISTIMQSTDDFSSSLFKSHQQEMLFRSMHRITDTTKRPKSAKKSTTTTYNRLAQPKSHANTEKYALDDDKANCTFRPKINKRNTSEGDSEGAYSFVDRQYDEFKKHIEEMYYAQQQKDYDALVDKKICPSCGATQKYDEIREKRKLCPTCKEPYEYKVKWSRVAKNFYERQKKAAEKSNQEKENLLKSLNEEQLRGTRRIVRKGEVIEVSAEDDRKWDAEMEADFFKRMEETEMRKEARIKELEEELYGSYRREESKKIKPEESDFLSSIQRSSAQNRK